jgi:effector-binding domain-containing protein
MEHDIRIKEVPAQLALTVHARVSPATIPQGMGEAFGAIMAHVQAGGGTYAGPPFCLYPEHPGDDFEIVVCMPVAPGARAGEAVALEEIAGGTMATTVHKGPYSTMEGTYRALQEWMAASGRRSAGPPREIYLNDPGSAGESELLTEIDWPVT